MPYLLLDATWTQSTEKQWSMTITNEQAKQQVRCPFQTNTQVSGLDPNGL